MISYPLNHYVWWPSMNLHKGQDYIKLRNLPSLVASSFALPLSPIVPLFKKGRSFPSPPTYLWQKVVFLTFFLQKIHGSGSTFWGMLGVRAALTLEVGQHPGATETTCGFTQNHLWRRSPSSLGFLVQKNACWMLAGEDEECQWTNLMEK